MRSVRLLEFALQKEPKTVLDVGVWKGHHAVAFLGQGASVTGLDVTPTPLNSPLYSHIESPYEQADLQGKQFDMVWCSHVLEHVPNAQHFLIHLRHWLKEDGWLCMAVPTSRQNRLHIGHLSLWTPAHLVYNMICAGWNCKKALWYTDYLTIGLAVQKTPDISLSWRTGMPNEEFDLNQFAPRTIHHEDGAWWGNNWPDKFAESRVQDPPSVTIGNARTNLPPEVSLQYGANPALRKEPGTWRLPPQNKSSTTGQETLS
jgi:SAM-dependent methyltransferase